MENKQEIPHDVHIQEEGSNQIWEKTSDKKKRNCIVFVLGLNTKIQSSPHTISQITKGRCISKFLFMRYKSCIEYRFMQLGYTHYSHLAFRDFFWKSALLTPSGAKAFQSCTQQCWSCRHYRRETELSHYVKVVRQFTWQPDPHLWVHMSFQLCLNTERHAVKHFILHIFRKGPVDCNAVLVPNRQ